VNNLPSGIYHVYIRTKNGNQSVEKIISIQWSCRK
jgi:hypothetical protein